MVISVVNMKERYTLVRVFYIKNDIRPKLTTEEIECKTLKEAISLGAILTEEEKVLGSYILDNASHKKLTLTGK